MLKFLLAPIRFLLKLWQFHPDVIHFNPSFDPKSIIRELTLIAISKLHRRAVLVQFHGGNVSQLESNGDIPVYLKLVIKWASQLVVLTNIQKKPLLKYCPLEKISLVPNMVDTTIFTKPNHRYRSSYRILYMSKIESKKGALDVLEASPEVIEKFPNSKFLFAGDGPDINKIKLLCCEMGLEDHVKIMGYLRDKKKAAFLSRGDIFLFPSHYDEGMPYALLEAMAAGLPIISTANGGIPDVIENWVNGILIQPKQAGQLARAIIKLLSNKKARTEFGKLNRFKAESEYDIKIVNDKFKKIYERLAQSA